MSYTPVFTTKATVASMSNGHFEEVDIPDIKMREGEILFKRFLCNRGRMNLDQLNYSHDYIDLGAANAVLYTLAKGGYEGFFEEGSLLGGKAAQGISISYTMDNNAYGHESNRQNRQEENPSNYFVEAQRYANAYVNERLPGVLNTGSVKPRVSSIFDQDNRISARRSGTRGGSLYR